MFRFLIWASRPIMAWPGLRIHLTHTGARGPHRFPSFLFRHIRCRLLIDSGSQYNGTTKSNLEWKRINEFILLLNWEAKRAGGRAIEKYLRELKQLRIYEPHEESSSDRSVLWQQTIKNEASVLWWTAAGFVFKLNSFAQRGPISQLPVTQNNLPNKAVPLFRCSLSFSRLFLFSTFSLANIWIGGWMWRRFFHSHNNLAIFGETKKTMLINFIVKFSSSLFGIDHRNLNFICASTPLPHHGALIKSRNGQKSTFRSALACCHGSGCCDRGHSSCPIGLHSHTPHVRIIIYHYLSIDFLSAQSILFLVAASESGRGHVPVRACASE